MMRFLNPMTLIFLAIMLFSSLTSGRFENPQAWLMSTLLMMPAILIGLSFHEFAHAYVANKLGDPTPKYQGRVTVNPMAHVDPIGIICLIFLGFGWGLPVQINPRYFKNTRRDEFLVAISGITLNFILAIVFAGLVKLIEVFALGFAMSSMGEIVVEVLLYVVKINLVLMVFNLLPVPPLDGFNIITQVFNLKQNELYYKIYDKGMIILLVLILFNITDVLIFPALNFFYSLVMGIFF